MLSLDNASLSLADRHWQFSFSLQTHGAYALLGRSGSGKSTLLNLIGGFIQPDSGDILWNGQSLVPLQPAQRPITTLFQQHNLFNHLSVWKNIALGIAPNLSLSASDRQRISSVLNDVGLAKYDNKKPPQLSGGEQQRVALARCLLRQKPVLLLDEPFSALDATTRSEMIQLLKELIGKYKPCVIMITHDQQDATALNASILDMQTNKVVLRDDYLQPKSF
ncbi:MAG: ATP-binding cassette domain-containing protein [Granulosicoccus sp.]